MTRNEAKRIAIALVITGVILVGGFFFVTRSVMFCYEGIGMSDVDIIKRQTLFRVVPPAWVTPGPEGLVVSWMKTEMAVRSGLVLATWLILLIFTNPYSQKKGKSNQKLESISGNARVP